jgi:hypothetical protein
MAAVLVDAIESGDLEAARIAYAALSLGSRSSVSEEESNRSLL